ncbi:MAG TPA: FAD-binding oxidoreductase, partial [Pyrinomonadaceae bacterium]|nr:FAD-binding oxidoreductase [Pyrinomonadaceae bacterium]
SGSTIPRAINLHLHEENIMQPNPSFDSRVTELAARFCGQLLKAGDTGYEEARKVHNGLIDRRPLLIARCYGVADVVDAVKLARALDLDVAIRGGGHNVAGRATIDGGLMIDLMPMKGIHVDPLRRTARAQGGVTWAEFNRETQLHGLAVTGGVVSSTGIAGLTLGGGLGWLMGKYGLALDNLISVELVTAEGEVLRTSKDEHPDLFWAVRGGGGNFGIATWFEYQLHAVGPMITGGLVAHPFEKTRDVLRFYRDTTASVPDELTMFGGLIHSPDGAKLCAIVAGHCGSLEEGERAMRPIKEFGSPLMDTIGPMPYSELNGMLDAGYPKGALNYWKSSFLKELNDDVIEAMIECFSGCPTPMGQMLLENFHGAATRVGVSETAFPHRADGYNLLVLSQWMAAAETDRCTAWARTSYGKLEPFVGAGRYVNYLGDDEPGDPALAAYGPNYDRLRKIKTKYDPTNFFHMNQNIKPL